MKNRPRELESKTIRIETGCGWLYITLGLQKNEVVEISASLGKSGGCASANLKSITGLINMGLEKEVNLEDIYRELRGQRCHNIAGIKGKEVYSCSDGIAQALEPYLPQKEVKEIVAEVKENILKETK